MDSIRDWAPTIYYKEAQLIIEPKQYTSRDKPTSTSNFFISSLTYNLNVKYYTPTRAGIRSPYSVT